MQLVYKIHLVGCPVRGLLSALFCNATREIIAHIDSEITCLVTCIVDGKIKHLMMLLRNWGNGS